MSLTEEEKEEIVSRRVRRVSKVMAFVFLGWMLAQWLGGKLGLPVALLPILDFIALASFIWALFEIWNVVKLIRKD